MANCKFLLTSPRRWRRERREWLIFLNGLLLYQQAGTDLAHAWNEVIDQLSMDLDLLQERLELNREIMFSSELRRVSAEQTVHAVRLWLNAIADLYDSGAGMVDCLMAFEGSLVSEERYDLESHCRTLPTRSNILLLLFFLPATFAILFLPLLSQLARVF